MEISKLTLMIGTRGPAGWRVAVASNGPSPSLTGSRTLIMSPSLVLYSESVVILIRTGGQPTCTRLMIA